MMNLEDNALYKYLAPLDDTIEALHNGKVMACLAKH